MIIDFTKNKFRTKGQDSGGCWIHGGGDSGGYKNKYQGCSK
jgi:hypothetical protein